MAIMEVCLEEAVASWIDKIKKYRVKHYNSLDLKNKIIEEIIVNNKDLDPNYVIQKLKVFYWTNCEEWDEFEREIIYRINIYGYNIDSLLE